MANKKSRFYVIWNTPNRGVYAQKWDEIKHFVLGVSGSLYHGFKTLEEAQKAYDLGYYRFKGISPPDPEPKDYLEDPLQSPHSGLSTQPEGEEDDCPF